MFFDWQMHFPLFLSFLPFFMMIDVNRDLEPYHNMICKCHCPLTLSNPSSLFHSDTTDDDTQLCTIYLFTSLKTVCQTFSWIIYKCVQVKRLELDTNFKHFYLSFLHFITETKQRFWYASSIFSHSQNRITHHLWGTDSA